MKAYIHGITLCHKGVLYFPLLYMDHIPYIRPLRARHRQAVMQKIIKSKSISSHFTTKGDGHLKEQFIF